MMNKHILIIVFIIVATAVLFAINNSSRYEGFKRKGKSKTVTAEPTNTTVEQSATAASANTTGEQSAATAAPVTTTTGEQSATAPPTNTTGEQSTAAPVTTTTSTAPIAPSATPPIAPSATATPPVTNTTSTTENKDFINKALQQPSVDNEIEKLRKSLSVLQTELDAATTAATSSKAVFNEAIKSIGDSKNNAISELDNKIKTLSAVEDQVNKKAKEAEQSKSDAQQIKTDVASMVNTIQLKIDNIATNNLTKDKFTTLEQAYNTNISNLWNTTEKEGFNDGKPWTDADLFTLTNNLSTALKTFHKTYYEYAACYYKTKPGAKNTCTQTDLLTKKSDFDTAVQSLNAATAAATTAVKSLKTNENKIDDATATERNAALKSLALQIANTRTDLDQKMKTLEHNDKNYEPEKQLTAAQYATIGWSVLAASALYYIFTELSE